MQLLRVHNKTIVFPMIGWQQLFQFFFGTSSKQRHIPLVGLKIETISVGYTVVWNGIHGEASEIISVLYLLSGHQIDRNAVW